MRIVILTLTVLVGFAGPLLANQCPSEIAALDDMMRQHGSMLTPQQQAEVEELREQAVQAHEAGRHQEALQAVQSARTAMGM